MKLVWLAAVGGLILFVQTGCSELSNSGSQVPIPSITVKCQTTACRTTYTNPRITLSITGSGCSARTFDEKVNSTSTSITCSGTGCVGLWSGSWVDSTGATKTTVPSGTYSICACINSNPATVPWTSCQTLGELNNVSMTSSTGTQTLDSWTGN